MSHWYISEAAALERDRKVAAPILRAIIDCNDASAPVIRRELKLRGYSMRELQRLLPVLEAQAGVNTHG